MGAWSGFDIGWANIFFNLFQLSIAFILALPLGFNREKSSIGFGLRTFPLVAVASCGIMLVGMSVIDSTDGESRVMEGLITGIGFIGGGAIFRGKSGVAGTATAASIWSTGGIGISVAFARYEIAILLSLLNFITLRYLNKAKIDIEPIEDA